MKPRILLLAPLLLGTTRDDGLAYAGFGRTVYVDGPRVTPVRLLEDSRCPMRTNCIWPGHVRLQVRVRTGAGSRLREITSNKPIPVADGELELVSVTPPTTARRPIHRRDYRFGFRFIGGL